MTIKLQRFFAMPNKNTFSIRHIKEIISKYAENGKNWVDPFANTNIIAEHRNDLNPNMPTDYHLDATMFLRLFDANSVNGVLLDPPYSFHQIVKNYDGYGDRRLRLMTSVYDEACRIVKHNGYIITFGWNTNGCGKKRGCEKIAIYICAHGGSHNDTLITVEQKI